MASVCIACAKAASVDVDATRCCFCVAVFHINCTAIPAEIRTSFSNHPNLHLSCPECTDAAVLRRRSSSQDAGFQAGFQSALNSIVASLKDAIIPLTCEMRSLLSPLKSSKAPATLRQHSALGELEVSQVWDHLHELCFKFRKVKLHSGMPDANFLRGDTQNAVITL
uniref:Uncharacterized protein n=1 Tax=Anopheles farauti TaxID=69004 RepID=A0A182QPB7_9DIPT